MARSWKVNVAPAERVTRVVVAGLGALGHRPLCARLGNVPGLAHGEDFVTTPTTGPDRPHWDLDEGVAPHTEQNLARPQAGPE